MPRSPETSPEVVDWLHDTVLQALEFIASRGYSEPPAAAEDLSHVAGRAADDLREALAGYVRHEHAPDLRAGLAALVSDARCRTRTQVRLTVQCPPLEGDAVGVAVGATREALNNVIKHAHAGEAGIYARCLGSRTLEVRIADDGIGFDSSDSIGFRGIRRSIVDRVAQAGGMSRIASQPGHGTLVELRLPVRGRDHE